jgi:hypothetical protein
VSRRRATVVRASRNWARTEARLREARNQPADVTVRYACPLCGKTHTRLEHAAPGCHGLTDVQLQELRASAVDELVNAVRHDAPAEHIKDVVAVLDVVDARLGIGAQ